MNKEIELNKVIRNMKLHILTDNDSMYPYNEIYEHLSILKSLKKFKRIDIDFDSIESIYLLNYYGLNEYLNIDCNYLKGLDKYLENRVSEELVKWYIFNCLNIISYNEEKPEFTYDDVRDLNKTEYKFISA